MSDTEIAAVGAVLVTAFGVVLYYYGKAWFGYIKQEQDMMNALPPEQKDEDEDNEPKEKK